MGDCRHHGWIDVVKTLPKPEREWTCNAPAGFNTEQPCGHSMGDHWPFGMNECKLCGCLRYNGPLPPARPLVGWTVPGDLMDGMVVDE